MTRRERAELWALVALAALLVELVDWHRRAPTVFADEAGTLGNARWVAGGHLWHMGSSSTSDLGFGLLFAPVTLLAPSPAALYRLVVLQQALMCGLLLATLHLLVRRGLGASHRTALLAAACGTAYPAVAAHAGLAWAETTAILGMSLLLTTALLVARTRTPTLLLVHGTTGAFLGCTHGRFTAVPVLVVAWLVVLAVRHRDRWAGVAAVWTLLLLEGLRHVQHVMQDQRWERAYHPPVNLSSVVDTPVHAILRSALGQTWYAVAATAGLVLLGLVLLVWAAGDRVASAYVALLVLSVFGVSVLYLSIGLTDRPEAPRADNLYYGRYLEAFVPTLVAAGAAAVLQPRWRRLSVAVLAGSAVLGPLLLGLTFALSSDLSFAGTVMPYMMSALLPLLRLDDSSTAASASFVWLPAIVSAVVALALAALTVVRRTLAVVLLMVLFATVTLASRHPLAAGNDEARAQIPAYERLRDLGARTVAYDPDTVGPLAFYAMPFWLDESEWVAFDSGAATWRRADLYVGPLRWPEATRRGLRLVGSDPLSRRGFYAP